MKALKVFLLSTFLCVSSISLADSESEKEAARLLNITGMERDFEQSISQMLDVQLQQNPTLVPYKEVMLKFFNKHMSYERLEPDLLRIYSEAFTADELSEINSFYTTEVGKKTIETMPVLMAQSVEIGVAHLQENIGELQAMIEAEAEAPLQAALIEEGEEVPSPELDLPEFPFAETTETDFEGTETGGLSPSEIAEVYRRCEGYRYGTPGYPKNQETAFTWCTQSAELGDPYGQSILGALYYSGEGVEQSYRDALYWFTLAANRGMPYAAFALFQMYLEGNGTKVDQRTAFMYLSRSAELGGKEAMEVFAQINAQATSPPPSNEEVQGLLESQGMAKFAPTYPPAAQAAGIEGYVVVEYCVDFDGRPMNIRVIESVPEGLFDEASIAATKNFHYLPALDEGVPVERHGVQNKFTFELEPPVE